MNLDWNQATTAYALTKKAFDDRRDYDLREELKGINSKGVDKTQIYSSDQIAELTDSAEKAGGKWNEQAQAYQMPDGSMQAPTNVPTWENGAYKQNGAAVTPKTQYSFDGGAARDTDYSADELKGLRMQSRADVYRNYGKDLEADQLEAAGLQRRASMQTLAKGDLEAEREKKWESYTTEASSLYGKYSEIDKQAEKLIKAGDTIGAARLLAQFRTDTIPDGRAVIINQDGVLTGVDNDGTTRQSDKNAYNPNVVASMRSDLKGSIDEYLKAKRPSMGFANDRLMSRDAVEDNRWTTTRNDGRQDRFEDVTDRRALRTDQKEQWGAENNLKGKALDQAWEINKANLASAEGIAARQNSRALEVAKLTKGAYETLTPFGTDANGKPVFQSNQNGVVTLNDKGDRVQVTDVSKVKRFATEPKDNTKAQEAYYKYLADNPDATAEQKQTAQRDLGLAARIDFAVDPFANKKGAGLNKPLGNITSPTPSGLLPIGKDGNIVMEKPAGFVRPNPWTSNPN